MATSNRAMPDAATQREIYRRMSLIKANDERSRRVIKSGKLVMPYYSPRGQEVIPSAVSVNLTDDDYICTIYRGTHDMIAKGIPLNDLWAELAGRVTGTCKGKGGPMHITHPKSGVMVTTGIVGSSMPIANGLAWASQLRGDGRVAVAYFGDGASNIGAFHESLNLAAVWKLPVIFVCQNNEWGEHTAYEKSTSAAQIADRAIAYGIPGLRVDGNDPFAMYGVAREAIERARAGEGPTLIEAMTYRMLGHVFGSNFSYVPKALLEEAAREDGVPKLRARLLERQVAEATLAEIEAAADAVIAEAVEHALSSPYPDPSEIRRDVLGVEIAA